MNATLEKFGYPDTLVAEFDHWVVLARAAQPTLGSLVLAAKSDVTAFGDLPVEAHADLKRATSAIEAALAEAVSFAKVNYLMLMMVDPHVHFHVIPRYDGAREWGGREFVDCGWPKVPDLGHAVALEGDDLAGPVPRQKSLFRDFSNSVSGVRGGGELAGICTRIGLLIAPRQPRDIGRAEEA